MRHLATAFTLSLLCSATAFADDAAPAKSPDLIDKVTSSVAGEPKPFVEPNLKFPKDSGGKVTAKSVLDAPLPDDYSMGKKTAQINLIEYASMSCPHCAHFTTTVLPEIIKKYIETGKVRYILRQFPLNEPALKAADLLECLGDQNESQYYVFAKVLFDAQNKWAFDANYMTNLETIASVGGVSKDQFASCTGSIPQESKVLKQQKLAKDELQVPHTPYIIVGDEIYAGDRTPENLSTFIDKKLAEKQKK